MNKAQFVLSASLLCLLLVACAPQAAPAPAPPAPPPASAPAPAPVAPVAVPAKAGWQVEWQKVQEAARREGVVIIHNTGAAEIRSALVKVAKSQEIRAEVTGGRALELLTKLVAERRAGIYIRDVYWGGYASAIARIKTEGFLEPLDAALIVPDLTAPESIKKLWYQGKLPWVDDEHTIFMTSLQPAMTIAVSTSLVKPDEVTSYRDLLDPKWRGKIVVNDPMAAGTGLLHLQGILKLMGEDYIRELAATKPVVLRDERLMLEWLSQGKVPILVAPKPDGLTEFIKVGAPVKGIIPKEGAFLSGGASGFSLFKNAPHPNAARVFINSIASKEGQEIFSVASTFQSARLDVSTAHLAPEKIRKDGVNYLNLAREEVVLVDQPRAEKLSAELFAPLTQK